MEEKVSRPTAPQGVGNPGKQAWQQTFALSRDDPGFEEMVQLRSTVDRRNLGGLSSLVPG